MYDQERMQRKLAHYNVWLLDPKRTAGIPYPGFPEELQIAKGRAILVEEVKAKAIVKLTAHPKKVKTPSVKTVKTPSVKAKKVAGAPTKQDMAMAIYTRLGKDKAAVIAAIQAELGMSAAGASTYFYNAKKLA